MMIEDRHVFVGMPGYSHVTGGAARGFWRSTKLPDAQTHYGYSHGSLLAANFNTLWVEALNARLAGKRVDYFAMQHADIEPQDWWLDTLIEEMESRSLDILGVVAPIKDGKGLTSIALARPDGDDWRPRCRLTMSEVFRLPETFTSEDVGHPLLLNTGLWVCRFDPEWARKVHFTINDRIVFDTYSGRYLAQCEPEDWFFSRLCHELGLKIGCTRKIKLTHRGEVAFPNDKVWGEAIDSAWTDASVLPPEPDGFEFPVDVEGWYLASEARELARLAKGRRVLEIGSYCGLSTIVLARVAECVTSVDTHDGRGTPEPKYTLPILHRNLARYGLLHSVQTYVGGVECFHYLAPRPVFDLVHVDGAHDEESVTRDLVHALGLLAPGGLIACHDYGGEHRGVTAAVDRLIQSGAKLVSLTDSLAVLSPAA